MTPIPISEMAKDTPSWLNLELLETIMRKTENDNSIRVFNMFTKPATAKGDNYTSDMYRVSIEISCKRGNQEVTKKKSLVVKIAPTGENIKRELVGIIVYSFLNWVHYSNKEK